MFGFFIGTVCLIALVSTLRHQYGFAGGGACGYGSRGFGRFGGPPWAARQGRSRWFLRRVFEQLDATPGQEKVIVKHVDSWLEHASTGRRELTDVRRQVAQALRGESLDEASLQAALEKVDDLLAKSKLELTQALTEIHASLDPEQRRDLADLLSYGPRHRRDFAGRF
jgi:Spy/CpxP family protein refolding chaperone